MQHLATSHRYNSCTTHGLQRWVWLCIGGGAGGREGDRRNEWASSLSLLSLFLFLTVICFSAAAAAAAAAAALCRLLRSAAAFVATLFCLFVVVVVAFPAPVVSSCLYFGCGCFVVLTLFCWVRTTH